MTTPSLLESFLLFTEGILSFLSPCVIPILPIYISILAGKKELSKQGQLTFNRKNIIINTLFFTFGISTTFFLLAFATSYISIFLNEHLRQLQIFSGILIIFMGLLQLGIFKINFLNKEFSMKNKIKKKREISPLLAFLMGFTFSFSWTPCIGPILASVFLYASSHSGITGIILILLYCLGFILPFIICSLFATKILSLLRKNQKVMQYTTTISGIILILIGLSILTGLFNTISHYFS